MTNVYTIISNSTDNKDKMIREDREKIQVEFAFERLTQDFEQIYSPLFHHTMTDPKVKAGVSGDTEDYDDQNQQATYDANERYPMRTYKSHLVPSFDSEDKSSLTFFTTSHRRRIQDSKQSRFNWVHYELRDPTENEENTREGRVLIRKSISERIYNGDHEWDKVKGYVLLKNIKELSFSFWNEDRQAYVDSPRELNEKKNQIRLIRANLIWIDEGETEVQYTRYIRTLWPFYDTRKDEKIIKEAFKNVNNNNNNVSGESTGSFDEN